MELGKSFSARSFMTSYLYTAQQLSLSFGCILTFFFWKICWKCILLLAISFI